MTTSPTRETWRALMTVGFRVIDSLAAGYGDLDFRLGGGTVLMFRFDHRISKDIDIFFDDAQALSFISPRLNDAAAAEVLDYEEQANTVKLLLTEGDIDFIVAAPVFPHGGCEWLDINGRSVALDSTAEVLAKKLLYRADSFKARDVFDMATALTLDPAAAMMALRATRRTHSALSRRLIAMAGGAQGQLGGDIAFTESGRLHEAGMIARLQRALDAV